MNTGIHAMMVVMRKELRDFFRDRRTMMMTLLLTPLLYPAMLLGMGKLAESRASTQLEKPMTIPSAGAEQAPTLVAHLASQGIAIRKATAAEIETIDMARRGIHNSAAELLLERLDGKVETDFDTARRLFTLICVLHIRQ